MSPKFSESLTEFRVGRNIADSIEVVGEIEERVDFWVIGIGEGLNRL